jgi:outer membrane protein assembly factor BamB
MKMKRTLLLGVALLLAGCEFLPDWLGESKAPPLPGERISILALEKSLEPDPRLSDLQVRLPRPYVNKDWPQDGGHPTHAMYHLQVGDNPVRAWRVGIGAGTTRLTRLLVQPVIAENRVFTLDAEGQVTAFGAEDGKRLWRALVKPAEEDSEAGLGGGLAFDEGRLVVATGYGTVIALDPATGKEQWRNRIGIPVRAAPTVSGGRVFVVSYDNQLHTLAASDGRQLWTHAGITENAGMIGSAGPAVSGDIVVVPYSSGELFALRADTGRVIWSDALVREARSTPLAFLNGINGRPVIDRDRVLAISRSGRMVALDLRTGDRIWERDIAGIHTPWAAGEFIYVVSTQAEVICLSRADGRIRWLTPLPRYQDPKDKKKPIQWSGPILASDRLVLVSSHGTGVSLSPYTGEAKSRVEFPDGTFVAPVVADGTLYVLTDAADLIAMR